MNSEANEATIRTTNADTVPVVLQSPPDGRLVSVTIPAPEISADLFLDNAEGQERFFWQNGQGRAVFAGFGKALEIMAWGTGRFKEIRNRAAALFSEASVENSRNHGASPRLFGGFSFRDDFTPDNTWAVFHPAHFILPHYQYYQEDSEAWLTINAMLLDDEDIKLARKQLQIALTARYQSLKAAANRQMTSPKPTEILQINYPMSFTTWKGIINRAKSSMQAKEIEKVVLARVCEIRARQRIDVRHALKYLNSEYPECTRFLFEPRLNHSFFGATPELLAKVRERMMQTMALAGSIKRGDNADEDFLLTTQLRDSIKDRYEHMLVVNSIQRRLHPLANQIKIGNKPEIFTLSYIHHLLTFFNVELNEALGVLPLVEILHPTPALGGSPRQKALNFIRSAEPVPRGWFAGPIGWIDATLDGEFSVAIRSAIAQERRVWLYAGAGIVASSVPEQEWQETSLKFQPMLKALNIDGIQLKQEK
ncbi:MAG: isochorismate synthase [Candidatus Promineifilaceae bacterium]|nr:isochorismate synthase [Candidatus Promineifilaceae bacterium]